MLSSGVFRRETASGFYPWGKAHSRTAKCEAFHVAPRLFFMFLFFVPFTIRQQCTIYPKKFSTGRKKMVALFRGLLVEMGKMFIFALLLTN